MTSIDYNSCPLRLDITQQSPTVCSACVTIPAALVNTLYRQAVVAQQACVQTHGFHKGTVPLDYIAQNFKKSLVEHLKEFLFNYFVISFLYRELRARKFLMSGEPRLASLYVEPGHDAVFTFDISTLPALAIQEWKYLPFKAPKRKKYKDLDRQVEAFIKDELALSEKQSAHGAQVGDWISFDIKLVNAQNVPLIENYHESLWFKLGDEEADVPLSALFIGKHIGETFCSTNQDLQSYFSHHINTTTYNFLITITDILHNRYFCLEQFKRHFKLKTNKEVYQKLIEVFSYRNDLSQRRSMAEETLKLLISKHRFDVPNHIILRQQTKVLEAVQSNPDYHVYRMQKDFKRRVKQLAEKQAKEHLLLDQMAYNENVSIAHQDIKSYLNLTNRPRTKEFIYFDPLSTRLRGQEAPICAEELKQICLREKTLNHMIYHLTKA
jgi:FKBP-type peptidyl-prolyl cis-trans isomerase (trigger factor)